MKLLAPYYLLLEYLLIMRIKLDELMVNKMPDSWDTDAENRNVIILLPGVHSKAHGLKKIGNAMNLKGYRVLTIDQLKNNTMSVVEASDVLEKYLKENKISKVTIIAHSKGGLIAKYFIDNSKERNRIIRIVSISTPYKGSILAYLIGDKDMLPNSKIVNNFKSNNNSTITQLYPSLDNHVIPNKNLILGGGNNIAIDIVGHTRILWSQKTINILNKLL